MEKQSPSRGNPKPIPVDSDIQTPVSLRRGPSFRGAGPWESTPSIVQNRKKRGACQVNMENRRGFKTETKHLNFCFSYVNQI